MEKKNYIDEVKFYLETNTNLKIRKEKGNWLKIEDSDIILYVNASKLYTESKPYYGWYDLSENTYNDILNNTSTNFFNLILLKDMSTIFLIPRSDFLKIFDKKYMTKPHEWMFNIFIENGKYILKFTNESGQHEITNYLNRWEEILRLISNIQEVKNQDQELLANESEVYVLLLDITMKIYQYQKNFTFWDGLEIQIFYRKIVWFLYLIIPILNSIHVLELYPNQIIMD